MFVLRLISRLPFPVLYFFSDVFFLIAFFLVRYRRKMVWRNLRNAFPEKDEQARRKIERQFYRNLCDYAVETLKLLTISREEIARRMVFTNPEVVSGFFKEQRSVLQLTAHQFNWEWLLAHGSFVYHAPMDFVYQRVNNEFFNKVSVEIRTRFGGHAILRDEVARESIRRKNIIRGIAIVADQYPGYKSDKKYQTTFLHQETVFFYGSNQLAVMLQYPVVFYSVKKIRRGYYETTAIEIAQPPFGKKEDIVIENYVRAVERTIREDPASWLWSHNRWKKRHLTPG